MYKFRLYGIHRLSISAFRNEHDNSALHCIRVPGCFRCKQTKWKSFYTVFAKKHCFKEKLRTSAYVYITRLYSRIYSLCGKYIIVVCGSVFLHFKWDIFISLHWSARTHFHRLLFFIILFCYWYNLFINTRSLCIQHRIITSLYREEHIQNHLTRAQPAEELKRVCVCIRRIYRHDTVR